MKKLLIVMLISIIAVTLLLASGCEKEPVTLENSWDVPDYVTSGTVVSGLSALTVFNEALANYNDAEYMTFIRSMDFDAGIAGKQQTIDITKYNNGSTFTQGTKQGTGAGESYDATRFYYDGTNAFECKVREDAAETRFPALGTEDWSGLTYAAYDATDKSVSDKLTEIKRFSLYVFNLDTLSDNHNDSVYLLDGKYYICLTIDCMDITTGGVQKAVEDDIMSGLGANAVAGSFEWKADTKLYMELTKIDDQFYITARNLQENYQADQKQFGIDIPVECTQVTSGTYAYEESYSEITDLEKMDKA